MLNKFIRAKYFLLVISIFLLIFIAKGNISIDLKDRGPKSAFAQTYELTDPAPGDQSGQYPLTDPIPGDPISQYPITDPVPGNPAGQYPLPAQPSNGAVDTGGYCPESYRQYPQCGGTVGLQNYPVTDTVMVTEVKNCRGNIIRYDHQNLGNLGQCQPSFSPPAPSYTPPAPAYTPPPSPSVPTGPCADNGVEYCDAASQWVRKTAVRDSAGVCQYTIANLNQAWRCQTQTPPVSAPQPREKCEDHPDNNLQYCDAGKRNVRKEARTVNGSCVWTIIDLGSSCAPYTPTPQPPVQSPQGGTGQPPAITLNPVILTPAFTQPQNQQSTNTNTNSNNNTNNLTLTARATSQGSTVSITQSPVREIVREIPVTQTITREIIREVPVQQTVVTPAVVQAVASAPQVVKVSGDTQAKELPKTGLPLLGYALAGLLPLGLRLRRIGKFSNEVHTANFLIEERLSKIN